MKSVAPIIGAALIAAAIALSFRYTVTGAGSAVWRVDRWTGAMWFCTQFPRTGRQVCYPARGASGRDIGLKFKLTHYPALT